MGPVEIHCKLDNDIHRALNNFWCGLIEKDIAPMGVNSTSLGALLPLMVTTEIDLVFSHLMCTKRAIFVCKIRASKISLHARY